MLWVLKITVLKRCFFSAPKTYVKTDGLEHFYNFMLTNFVYLNLWLCGDVLKGNCTVLVCKEYEILFSQPLTKLPC